MGWPCAVGAGGRKAAAEGGTPIRGGLLATWIKENYCLCGHAHLTHRQHGNSTGSEKVGANNE